MKSKISKFIITLIMLLVLALFCFLGIILYNEFRSTDVVGQVEEFVSNFTIEGKQVEQEIIDVQLEEKETPLSPNHTSSNNNYFYNQLDDYSKIIYDKIDENKENMRTGTYEISFENTFSDVLSKDNGDELLGEYFQSAIEAYTYDNPDVFYIDFSKLYLNIETTTRGTNETYRVFLNAGQEPNYLEDGFDSKENVEIALDEVEKVKDYFVQNKTGDVYSDVKLIHDYLVDSIEYDETLSESNIYDIYGALVNKKSVCEGYARAFKYLLDSIDIPCVMVSGLGTNSEGITENHAWNYVQINDVWYAVDCTWDDPLLIGGGILTNSLKYQYFLKGQNEFNSNHIPNGQFTENGKVFEFPQLNMDNY